MEKSIIEFEDIEIQKQNIYQHKRSISIKNIVINKIVVSNKASFDKSGFNYFIGCKDSKKIKLLRIFLPKTSTYRKRFYKTNYVSFLIKGDNLLEKYNTIWEKVRNSVKKEFGSEPVYNKKNLKP